MKMTDWSKDVESQEVTVAVTQDTYMSNDMHIHFKVGTATVWELRMTKAEYAAFITTLDSVTML